MNEEQQTINFGGVKVGNNAVINVPIINRSKKAATISLARSTKALLPKFISFAPNTKVTIKPKESLNIAFTFEPKARIPAFSEELQIEVEGALQTLLFVGGAGHGVELKLENDIITFGAVVQNGSSSQKVKLKNMGDIPTRFKWDVNRFEPDFTITPVRESIHFSVLIYF